MEVIVKSLNKRVKYGFNLAPFSKATSCGYGYRYNHVLLNIWITLADNLSMYSLFTLDTSLRSNQGNLIISNQPVVGSTIFRQARLTPFLMIVPPGCCCLIDLEYGPIRSICIEYHSFDAAIIMGGSYP